MLDSWSAEVEVQLKPDRPPLWRKALPSLDAIRSDIRELCVLSSRGKNKDKVRQLGNLTQAREILNEGIRKFLDLEKTWCSRAEIAKTEGRHDQVEQAEMRSRKYKDFASYVAQLLRALDELDSAFSTE